MKWFSKYPNWLYYEALALSNSSIYKEKFQFIDKTFVSTGDILVHKTKTEYHPILIVYPEATPFLPPSIYILKDTLEEEMVRTFSSCTPQEIRKQIQSRVKFFSERRHQNDDGSVCFIETGDLHNDEPEITDIEQIIKRLRLWLNGEVPLDSIEVELFVHFRNKALDIQYLIPDIFFDTEIVKGTFYVGLSAYLPANLLKDNPLKRTFMGILIVGENVSGIALPPKIYSSDQLLLFTHLPPPGRLISERKSNDIKQLIADKRVIEGFWWDISIEPLPFSDIETLAAHIGNKNTENGFRQLVKYLKQPLTEVSDEIHLGLRFPGRRREKDWQFFRLKRGNRSPLIKNEDEELKNRLLDYSIEAVQAEYFTEEYFHMRNRGRAERPILKDKKISIIGCGALGSELADCLCKAGIGSMILEDKEVFSAHNAIRHCVGIDKVSYPKVFGLVEYLVFHNPFVSFGTNGGDILHEDLDKYLPQDTIGISSIADDNVESFLNELAVERNRTVFYCRALRGGKFGRIFRIIPRQDACKTCLSLYRREKSPLFKEINEDSELPVITNECNNPVRPASAADLKAIASIAARIIIDYLEGRQVEKNHWIWATESLGEFKIEEPVLGSLYSYMIPPHPKCPTCQQLQDKKVVISKAAYDIMKLESRKSANIETGGILIGQLREDGSYEVLRATEPGPKAKRTEYSFEKDEVYCQNELEKAMKVLGEKGLYLGEWHYHPKGSNSPSGTDIKSLTEIAKQDNYRIEKPVMIILSPDLEFALTIHDKNGQCIQLPLEIIN